MKSRQGVNCYPLSLAGNALIPTGEGWRWSEQLQLYLGIHLEQLRYFTPEGQLVPTPAEAALLNTSRLTTFSVEMGKGGQGDKGTRGEEIMLIREVLQPYWPDEKPKKPKSGLNSLKQGSQNQ